MKEEIKNYLGIAIIVGIFLFVGVAIWYVSSFSKSVLPNRQFSVSAEGKVIAVPDVAEFSFEVLSEGGKNLADLQKENTEKANKIIAFLKKNGIEDKDIKTTSYNISPRYQYFSCPSLGSGEKPVSCPPAEIVGYTIKQSVLVKIRDLNKVGDIVGGVVEEGANTVSGPTFTVDDPTELQNQARQEAIAKAKEKAKTIAKAGGFRLGKLISLQESSLFPPPIPYALEVGGRSGDLEGAPKIEPGSQEIRVNVTLVYEIK